MSREALQLPGQPMPVVHLRSALGSRLSGGARARFAIHSLVLTIGRRLALATGHHAVETSLVLEKLDPPFTPGVRRRCRHVGGWGQAILLAEMRTEQLHPTAPVQAVPFRHDR